MLTHLHIEGLALIDSLSIDFSSGFNVITGETGAGKSILIRALNFLMGGKAGADSVRSGFDSAVVTGEFRVGSRHEALRLLESLGIECEEEAERKLILVRRKLSSKGRSQAWVNDVSVTSSCVKELGRSLVDLFAQHENQRLVDPQRHIDYLDDFIPDGRVRQDVCDIVENCQVEIGKIESILENFRQTEQTQDYTKFRLDELKAFAPDVDEFESLQAFCRNSEQSEKLRDLIAQISTQFEGDGVQDSVSSRLGGTLRLLNRLLEKVNPDSQPAEQDVNGLTDRLSMASSEIEEINFQIQKWLGEIDFDPAQLEEAQGRVWAYQDLFRKYRLRTVQELINLQSELEAELHLLSNVTEKVSECLERLVALCACLTNALKKLTSARRKAAKILQSEVVSELNELAMKGARFEVEFQPVNRPVADISFLSLDEASSARWKSVASTLQGCDLKGSERAQFLLSANPGEPLRPLTKVASGGEMSRIMLAIKKTLAADAETCVLVFDEIDTGISGRVADIVGKKMQELSRDFQVICISHLAQVAVYADAHFLVEKSGREKRTQSRIVRLEKENSAKEIARILSGSDLTQSSLKHAKEMISKAARSHRKPSKSL